jgi:hypothetical protein
MAHSHHKPNSVVEGPARSGHNRGLPRRPDDAVLEQRTEQDRVRSGLPEQAPEPDDAVYWEAHAEVDRQTRLGQVPTEASGRAPDSFPPSRYPSRYEKRRR